jgi:ABC-type Fe3+-siderophore transport system permease subunit
VPAVVGGCHYFVSLAVFGYRLCPPTLLLVGGGASFFGIVPAAALGAFGVIAVILFCSKFLESPVSLLIVGIMLGYFVDAAVSVLITVSDAEALRGYVLWGMGSLSRLTLPDVPRFAAVLAVGFLCIVPCVRYLNAARLGVGNQSLGLTEVAYQNALAYAKDRIQMRSLSGPKAKDKPTDNPKYKPKI